MDLSGETSNHKKYAMTGTVIPILLLAVFALRDAAALSHAGRGWAVYTAVTSAWWLVMAQTMERISRADLEAALSNHKLWALGAGLHLLLALAIHLLRERPAAKWFILFPAPAFLAGAALAAWQVLAHDNHLGGWVVGAALACVWTSAVLLASRLLRADWPRALSLMLGSNVSAVALFPAASQGAADSTTQPVDTAATLIALAVTSLLIAASFLVNKLRQPTWKGLPR